MRRFNSKGITLISLTITIAVLLILASIATYSGIDVIRQSKLDKFTAEMKVMQTQVNDLYQKYTDGTSVTVGSNTYTGEDILNKIGQDLPSSADSVFTSGASGITDKTGYRYYDQDIIKELNIDGVEGEFYVNVKNRSVISAEGLEYDGTTYYTLEQLPNGLYNVSYENKNTGKPTFDVSMEKLDNGTYRMTISNIQYDGYIEKWQVKYQKEGQDYWSTSEDLSFIVSEKGQYDVKLVNGEIESDVITYTPKLVKKWASEIDGNGEEEFLDVEKTSDGGYIAVGYTTSTNISGLTNKGSADCLIAKYDANGNEQWKKSVGGSEYDWYSGVVEITNGTYIAVGTILSTDVLDKNGIYIGHGYDWTVSILGRKYSMTASEGIIGTYDSNGNEITLKTTGKATNTYNGENLPIEPNVGFDLASVSSINIIMNGIDKVSDGGFVITGKRLIGVPSTFATDCIVLGELAIKYNSNGDEIAETNIKYNSNLGGQVGHNFEINNYKYIGVWERAWNGLIEKNDKTYILFGGGFSPVAGDSGLWKSNSNLENVQQFGNASDGIVRNCFLDNSDNYITLNYNIVNTFDRIEKQDDNGNMVWQYTDKVIKSISKSSEDNFVGISEDNKFLKYSMEDGSVVEEYDVPTYENVHAIEGEEEFILLGTPTNEEGITIEGTSGAVIAKYAIE